MSTFMQPLQGRAGKNVEQTVETPLLRHQRQLRHCFWKHKICEEWLKDSYPKRRDWRAIAYICVYIYDIYICIYTLYIYMHTRVVVIYTYTFCFLIHRHMFTRNGRNAGHCPNSLKGGTGCNPFISQHWRSGFEFHRVIRLHSKRWISHWAPTAEQVREQPAFRDESRESICSCGTFLIIKNLRIRCRALTQANICTANTLAMHHAQSAVNVRDFKDSYESPEQRSS